MKNFNTNWYCCGKYNLLTPYQYDETIYSSGIYKTKLTKEEMPDWYIYGQYYAHYGFMNCKVKDLSFRSSRFSNHMFKDCFLSVKYDKGNEEIISGNTIINFLVGCEKYGYDISNIKKQIDEHIQWVKEENECGYEITYNSFDELVERKKSN